MSNAAKPARLWLRDVRGKKFWYIRDDGRKIATGCGADDRAGAEEKLAEYITARVKPRHDSGRDPSTITIAELLNVYQQDRGAKIASPQELGQRVTALLGFFGTKPVTALNSVSAGTTPCTAAATTLPDDSLRTCGLLLATPLRKKSSISIFAATSNYHRRRRPANGG